jgi:C-terminal processing protease CtpA/Prc
MKRTPWILLAVLALTLGTAASASPGEKGHGEKGHAKKAEHRCDKNAQDCLDSMATHLKAKGWVGIETEAADKGFYKVAKVVYGSPAERAGFQAGDVLVAINGVYLNSEDKTELKQVKKSLGPGVKANYTVLRNGSKQQVAVTLSTVPDDVVARWVGEHMIDQHAYVQLAAN